MYSSSLLHKNGIIGETVTPHSRSVIYAHALSHNFMLAYRHIHLFDLSDMQPLTLPVLFRTQDC